MVEDIATGEKGFGFDFWADQIGPSLTKGSPPL